MENINYEQSIVSTLKNLARERGLRGYSRLRKAELIEQLRNPSPLEYMRAQLIQLARERGLRGYSRLNKAELLQRLRAPRDQILDRDNDARMINVPFLTPTPYTPPRATSAPTPSPSSNAVEDLIDYLDNVKEIPKSISPKLKKLQEEIDSIYEQMKSFKVRESNSALRNFAKVYTIDGKLGFDPQSFLEGAKQNITSVLRNNLRTKVKLILKCYMQMLKTNEIKPADFHSNIGVNLDGTDEKDLYDTMIERILEKIATFLATESEIRFHSVIKLELHTVSYKPLKGETWIPLPKELVNKNAIINMQNKDNKCFLWCVLRALNPKGAHPERLDKELMKKENILNMEGIDYPVSLKDINKFEKQNPNITIMVLGYEGKNVYPHRNSVIIDRDYNIILMLIEEGVVKHYCLVKSITRLLSSQASNGKRKQHFCLRCFNPFWCQEALDKHKEYCNEYEAVKIELPKKGTMLEFKNYHRLEKVPFLVYADFESFIKPLDTCDLNPESSYTKQYQKHEPSSFCYYIKCFDNKVYKPKFVSYTGEDAAKKFVEMLEEDIKIIANIPEKKMIFGEKEKEQFDKETKCWICNEEFEDDVKVKDHCHFTGRYRGAAHNSCNLKYRKPNFTPAVFHNLSGYDSHLFIKNLGFSAGNIDCIPNNEERYISFTKRIQVGSYTSKKGETKPLHHQIIFIDSFRFMATSLDKLVNNLPKDAFNNVKRYYADDKLSLLTRKGVYPYEYMNSSEKLKETQLPPREAFYSRLHEEGISVEDYEHARKVWEMFEMKNLGDYHNLYNQVDVLLLADVFENFRDICIKNYKLDPAHYYTAPGLAWDAALKVTEVKLELLSDMDMLLMGEKGIRGGVSMISNRYGKANNKYMGKSFIDTILSTHIVYLDANNLYGWAVSKPLPTHGFKWRLASWKLGKIIRVFWKLI